MDGLPACAAEVLAFWFGEPDEVTPEFIREAGIENCQVIGRQKHIYSLYQKMRSKHVSFHEVYDVYAFRIIANKDLTEHFRFTLQTLMAM